MDTSAVAGSLPCRVPHPGQKRSAAEAAAPQFEQRGNGVAVSSDTTNGSPQAVHSCLSSG